MMQLGGGGSTTTASTAVNAPPPPQPQSNDSAALAAAAATEAAAVAAVGAFEVSEEMNDRGFGGNRWPRQETLALLKIRSDMGIAFRDSNVKGPLWEEVSRKMAELGFIRNAKKCKEKFENVYKYHKRTKDGRTSKSDGKTYRFFDQLEALETHHQQPPQPQPLQPRPQNNNNNTVSFTTPPPVTTTVTPPVTNIITPANLPSFPNISGDFLSDNSTSSSSSYSTSSDIEISGTGTTNRKKRKRKWKDFFERLMKQVVDKQEELQSKFLEAVEKREHERLVREESWRVQEIARINREHELLAQERSMSAAKDAAVMSFLQKLSEKPQPPQPQVNNIQQTPLPPPQTPQPPVITTNGDQNAVTMANLAPMSAEASVAIAAAGSASRWPKVEIEALIKLRTNLDAKYQENGPKGPLWEQISGGMRRLGFSRNSKRCKEKWENINKYFKKVKESNKKRPQDSKTCPYFHQLDALYKERSNNKKSNVHNNNVGPSCSNSGLVKGDDNAVPLMVQPEQQWPPATATTVSTAVVGTAQGMEQSYDDEEGTDEEYDDEDEDENEEGEEEGEFELVESNNNKTTTN